MSTVHLTAISAPPSWIERAFWGSDLTGIEHKRGEHWWRFDVGDHVTLTTDGLWRVIALDRIVVTSEDDAQLFGRAKPVSANEVAMATLTGPIKRVTLSPGTADLRLDFGTSALEILSTSSGYEAWSLQAKLDGENLMLVATGGGGLAAPPNQRA